MGSSTTSTITTSTYGSNRRTYHPKLLINIHLGDPYTLVNFLGGYRLGA